MAVDRLYAKLRGRIEQHLILSPRLAVIHALLFTGFSVSAGLTSMLTRPTGMDGVIYWIIWFGSVVLLAHIAYIYLRSGAWKPRRVRLIQDEVLDASEDNDLTEEEMITLHLQLSDDLDAQARPFRRLLYNALINFLLWPGILILMLFIPKDAGFISLFNTALICSLLGTLIAASLIPIRQLFVTPKRDNYRLYAVYGGYKRKRNNVAMTDRLVALGDDGELILNADEKAVEANHTGHMGRSG